MFESPITMTRGGAVTRCSDAELRRFAAEFDRCHCVRVPRLLESDLLTELRERVDQSVFLERVHEGIDANSELCLNDDSVCGILQFIFNSRELFRFVQGIAGCERIGCFEGRVYRVVPGAGHHDAWHDDIGDHRMIAMSVNLGGDFQGGALQIRERESQRICHEVANTGPGDAIIFRIDAWLQHRITDIEGSNPKTAFAGWFRSQPDFAAIVNQKKSLSCLGASR
jgi:hypothetical protein